MATSFGDSTVQHARQELTSEDKKFAAVHLNETDETRENAVAEIKCWIDESDDLPARIDDFLILRFLRVCKFDLEKTKDKIRNYYKHRFDLPEWYTNKDPFQPELQELLDLGEHKKLAGAKLSHCITVKLEGIIDDCKSSCPIFISDRKHFFTWRRSHLSWLIDGQKTKSYKKHNLKSDFESIDFLKFRNISFTFRICLPLRMPDSQGRIVFLVRPTRHDPNIHEITNLVKIGILALETAMKYYPAGSIYGCVGYIDESNQTARHIFQLTPYVLKNMAHALHSCHPIRNQKIVFFNVPTIFDIIVRIFRSFMTEKLKSRLYVYSHKHCFGDIPPDALPVEYGGTGGTMQELTDYWKKLIEESRDWVTQDENGQSIQITKSTEEDFQQTHL